MPYLFVLCQFQSWKLRELERLTRDSEAREKSILERADLERRRNMSERDRLEEDTRLGKFESNKSQMKFLQKYYHKGSYYVDEESLARAEVLKRSFNEPTLEDRFDRQSLPAVLQVKKFGMRGRTKYTHLADQDTTDLKSPLLQGVRKGGSRTK